MSGKIKEEKQTKTVLKTAVSTVFDETVYGEDGGVYINPLTDFGFKRIFGEEANKDLLISFLNAVLKIRGGISDLTYTNPERKGRIKTDKSVFFDLHCTTKAGDRFIIEMQKLSQKYYKDRSLYYVSFPIQEQGLRQKKWNYRLHPVYSVNIVNFLLDGVERMKDQYIYYIQLMDRDTRKLFYDKLLLVYLELPGFNKPVEDLKTNVERWMYVLKHLSKLKDRPAALNDRIFKKFFEQAKIANMTPEEKKEYDYSLGY
jgi:predicted transposase/invertase (TIGR01784 family)